MTARRREVASGHDQEFGHAAIPLAKLISCRCDFQLLIAGSAAFQTVDVICRITDIPSLCPPILTEIHFL